MSSQRRSSDPVPANRGEQLKSMLKQLICTWRQENKVNPEQIICIRDGLSETQLDDILQCDVQRVVDAIREIVPDGERKKTISYVVVKRVKKTTLNDDNTAADNNDAEASHKSSVIVDDDDDDDAAPRETFEVIDGYMLITRKISLQTAPSEIDATAAADTGDAEVSESSATVDNAPARIFRFMWKCW